MFFGSTAGSPDPIQPIRNTDNKDQFGHVFLHSVCSLIEILEKGRFGNIEIEMKMLTQSDIVRKGQPEELKTTA